MAMRPAPHAVSHPFFNLESNPFVILVKVINAGLFCHSVLGEEVNLGRDEKV
jgi:hypothetical protein